MNDVAPAAVAAIRAALARKELVFILGAGLSAAATRGSDVSLWKGLVENGIQRCVDIQARNKAWAKRARADVASPYDEDLIAAAEKATSGMGGRTSWQYGEWLSDTAGSLDIQDSTLTDAVKLFAERGSFIATTNYDDILAQATGWDVVTWRDNTMLQRVYRGGAHRVIHLHGHWRQPDTVVFGSSSYADVLADPHAVEFLRMLMWANTVVFCGFGAGLRDPNFTALRSWLKTYHDPAYSHYRLVRSAEVRRAKSEHDDDEHIVVVPVGPNREDLAPFLRSIVADTHDTDDELPRSQKIGKSAAAQKAAVGVPQASHAARETLSQIAIRLARVKAIATDASPLAEGTAGEAIDPTDRDASVRFYNAFEDEATFVADAARNPDLTQIQADAAVGVGNRLVALLENPGVKAGSEF